MVKERDKSASHKKPLEADDAWEDDGANQKREYDRCRRRRLKAYHHLYHLLDGVKRGRCFYCRKKNADTLDHCPSLLMVDLLGVEYFQEREIRFLLIPACGDCNNNIGAAHVFHRGRLSHIDWRAAVKRNRISNDRRTRGSGS
jgi:hypothetical protein